MELIDLNKKIEEVYNDKSLGLNSVVLGDPYEAWNNSKTLYASLSFYCTQMRVEENISVFRYSIYCGDRLNNGQDNEHFIFQNCYKVIEKGLLKLNQNEDVLDISYPRYYNFISQKFMDVLACAYCEVEISVRNDNNICE